MTVWSYQGYYDTTVKPVETARHCAVADLLRAAIGVNEDFGACHIVLEDWNLEKSHIRFCLEQDGITPEGKTAMEAMLALSMRDRNIAMALADGIGWAAYSNEEWAEFDHPD